MTDLPLEDKDDCYIRYYPRCHGMLTKCENLMICHNRYSRKKVGVDKLEERTNKTLLRKVDKDKIRLWKIALILIIFLPLILIILFTGGD